MMKPNAKNILRWALVPITSAAIMLGCYVLFPLIFLLLWNIPGAHELFMGADAWAEYVLHGQDEFVLMSVFLYMAVVFAAVGLIISLIPIFFAARGIAPKYKRICGIVTTLVFATFPSILLFQLFTRL